ncbi:non-homologous end-joining DNA ligase [Nocardia altamirensis]|uniref:non-homologous end-joining DNA ligase n=1 Tax=Nocardia altamirensis TaxID=472158 RepID=UPI0008408059|nr:non-homologous end-joining DNA ligase [Nocardia altamirensis]
MLAVSGQPPVDAGLWAVEMKWDGIRAICRRDGGKCRFYSRNNRDIGGSFPELVSAFADLAPGGSILVDGEIVAPEPGTGIPSFHRLQRRMHVVKPTDDLLHAVPVQYLVFDLLAVDGESIMDLAYTERRARLEEWAIDTPLIRTPPYYSGVPATTMLEIAAENGLEGIVAKRRDSTYQPGRRSPAWIKTPLRRTTEAVVAGWLPGNGRYAKTFGSLILGAYDNGRLVHIGNVGTGWTMHDRRALQADLDELACPESPFDTPPPRAVTAAARWVEPRLVADIEFREVSGDGLRHPSWRGLRPDKSPHEVTLPK